MNDGLHPMKLGYEQIGCRCGAARTRGVDCECGDQPDPREVDQTTKRRQRIVRRAASSVSLAGPQPVLDVRDLTSRLADAVTDCMTGLTSAAADTDEGEAVQELARGLQALADARRGVEQLSDLRPTVAIKRHLLNVAESACAAVEGWLEALQESRPIDAERAHAKAQRQLDTAGEHALALGEYVDQITSAADLDRDGALQAALREAGDRWRSGIGLPEPAEALLTHADDDELRMVLHAAAREADLLFDPDRYWAVAARTLADVNMSPGLQTLASDSTWRSAYARHLRDMEDAERIVETVQSSAAHLRLVQRAQLAHYVTAVEAGAKFVLRTRLAATGDHTWDELRTQRLHRLLTNAEARGWDDDLDGLWGVARNAFSHFDYDLSTPDEPNITLDPDTPHELTLTWEEFEDLRLRCMESVAAMQLAITIALWGESPEVVWQSSLASMPVASAAGGLLASFGLPGATAASEKSVVTVTTSRLPDGVVTMIVVLARMLYPRAEAIRWSADGVTLDVTSAEVAELSPDEPLELAETLAAVRLNDEAVLTFEFIRRLIGTEFVTNREDPKFAMHRLRRVRSLADAVGDDVGSKLATEAIRACRTALTSGTAPTLAPSSIELIRSWASTPFAPHRLSHAAGAFTPA